MKKIGLALGSGSARALSHIGVIKVLQQNKIPIDYIAGASMGGLIAAYYALYEDVYELQKIATKVKRRDLIRLFDFANPAKALIKGDRIRRFLDKHVDGKTFADTRISLAIVTTDLCTGEDVILTRGKLIDAMSATISIPGVFRPVKIGSRYLVDGGVTNPTPVDVVKEMGADIVIGSDVTMLRKTKLYNPGIVETMLQSFEIIRSQAMKYKLEKVNGHMVIIKPNVPTRFTHLSFLQAERFIKEGERAAKAAMPKIKRLIS